MRNTLLLLCLLTVGLAVAGQPPLFRSYSYREGLQTYNIQKVIQDDNGFIWIATQDGLYRYNGKTFDIIKKNSPGGGLSENFVFDIIKGPGDSLFAAVFPGGIDQVNSRTLQTRNVTGRGTKNGQALPNQWIQKLQYAGGNLWAGGNDFLAILKSDYTVRTIYKEIKGVPQRLDISFLTPVSQDIMAAGIKKFGVVFLNIHSGEVIQVIPLANLIPGQTDENINDLQTDGKQVYISFDHCVCRGVYERGKWTPAYIYTSPLFRDLTINTIAFEKSTGTLWLGTDHGLARITGEKKQPEIFQEHPGDEPSLKNDLIANLFIDNTRNLWISSAGLLQMADLNQSPFRAFTGSAGVKMEHVYTLDSLNDSEIAATGKNGLFITNLGSGITTLVAGSAGQGIVHFLTPLSSGKYMVSTDNGLFLWDRAKNVFSQEQFLKTFPEWKPFVFSIFNNTFKTGSIVYLASDEQEGLLKWETGIHKITQFKNGSVNSAGLPENHIHNIKTDRDGKPWLLFDKYIASFDTGIDSVTKVYTYEPGKQGPPAGIYFDMFDDGNKLWFATYGGGVISLDKTNGNWDAITEKNGLCNNCVYAILPEKDSIFWVSTNMGISRINYFTKTCRNYYMEDGLQDNSFDEKGYFRKNHLLYFGGVNGFTEINTSLNISSRASTPVYISRMDFYRNGVQNTTYNTSWELTSLPAGTDMVSLYCCALRYPGAQRIKFFYKIKELGDNLLPVNENNQIDLLINRYGNFHVEIYYTSETGSLIGKPLTFNFYIHPKWFQTWWFKSLLILLVAAIVYGLYRLRIRQLKKEGRIRNQLAANLHDDLGSTLNSVKVYASLAQLDHKPEHLVKIKESTQEAISGIRDLIWVLDDKKDSYGDMLGRLSQFAQPLLEAQGIRFITKSDEPAKWFPLKKEEKRNLFLILKEFINNSIKYAQATELVIESSVIRKKIHISISDNGRGFNSGHVAEGNGLKNMSQRAADCGVLYNLTSTPGKGTRLELLKK